MLIRPARRLFVTCAVGLCQATGAAPQAAHGQSSTFTFGVAGGVEASLEGGVFKDDEITINRTVRTRATYWYSQTRGIGVVGLRTTLRRDDDNWDTVMLTWATRKAAAARAGQWTWDGTLGIGVTFSPGGDKRFAWGQSIELDYMVTDELSLSILEQGTIIADVEYKGGPQLVIGLRLLIS